jgi:hypothetical protein
VRSFSVNQNTQLLLCITTIAFGVYTQSYLDYVATWVLTARLCSLLQHACVADNESIEKIVRNLLVRIAKISRIWRSLQISEMFSGNNNDRISELTGSLSLSLSWLVYRFESALLRFCDIIRLFLVPGTN